MTVLHYPGPHEDPAGAPEQVQRSLEVLEGAWLDAIAAIAPHLGGLADSLRTRLHADARRGRTGEAHLLEMVDAAMHRARSACAPNVAEKLDRQLRRAVYEHLLALDAVTDEPATRDTAPVFLLEREADRVDERFRREPPTEILMDERIGTDDRDPHPQSLRGAAPPGGGPAERAEKPARWEHAEPRAEVAVLPPAPPPAPTGWSVRERTPAGHVQTEHVVALADVRRRTTEWIDRGRHADAAAVIQQVCQEGPGRAAALLATDTGDLCISHGKRMAAISCYIAALRADPMNEVALGRLADLCLEDGQVELGVAHLERIAQLARLRGDEREALRIYRRIVTVQPGREDILALLVQARAAGHPED